jgi:hypothetical protein
MQAYKDTPYKGIKSFSSSHNRGNVQNNNIHAFFIIM